MYTTGGVPEWPDELEATTGTVTYYGDNRHPGRALHDTQRRGNQILREAFLRMHGGEADRESLPVFLLFESVGGTRDVRFRGLVVPGSPHLDRDEQLSAIWRMEGGERFQNYRAKFTVLDVPVVTRLWLKDILAGDPRTSRAPEAWRDWVRHFRYRALAAPAVSPIRSKDEQLPAAGDTEGWALLRSIYSEFSVQPVLFEKTAVALAQFAVPLPTAMDVTRPSADGGRDAVGAMRIGHTRDPVWITLALEAKCYQPGQTAVGVKDMSRLISRLRYRDLGFMVTTSYVGRQAYEEIREDGHPVVVLSGGDIVTDLRRQGIRTPVEFALWARQIA
jgi:hypothetical protein